MRVFRSLMIIRQIDDTNGTGSARDAQEPHFGSCHRAPIAPDGWTSKRLPQGELAAAPNRAIKALADEVARCER